MNQQTSGPDPEPVVQDGDGHLDEALTQQTPEPDIEEAPRPWRVAAALKQLRAQADAAFPHRDKANDGTIGDAAHQSRASDHNPWVTDGGSGVVTAIDITNDPGHGCAAERIVEALRASRDRRIKYLIWNRRIANASAIGAVAPWTWRAYTGPSPHDHHFHLSVKADKALYDDDTPWSITNAEEAMVEETDGDALVAAALATLVVDVDQSAPVLPQLVDCQERLTRLMAYYAQSTAPAPAAERAEEPSPSALSDQDGTMEESVAAATARQAADDRRYASYETDYEQLFATAAVPEARKSVVGWHVAMLRKGRQRYQEVTERTGAPWWFVGIVHGMEASFSFTGHLHNGDPLSAKTVNVPPNRPVPWNPPSDWLSSAVDAITFQGFAHQADWSLARALYRFESYNGYGYHPLHINSPYLWSFSNHYTKGKFVRDGVFDPEATSKQCGAAVMLRALIDAGDTQLPD
jgi:lysozyme family protein